MLWQLHYAQTAQDALTDLLDHINSLVPLQQHAKGNLERRLSELLNSYYRLAATILRDRGNFEKAYFFANESVSIAMVMGTDPYALQIASASLYTRGVVNFARGVFGEHVKQGYIRSQREKIQAAILDFEQAVSYASPQLRGIVYSEMARAKALIANSSTDITIALKLLDQAEQFLDTDNNDDFYTQILLNGDLKGLDKKRLILGRAKTFLAMKRPGKAMDEFSDLEMLQEGSPHTRRRGWTQVLYAQAAFDLGDFSSATEKALNAFSSCQEANSITHLARVNELHTQLLQSPYGTNASVRRLGRLLGEVFPQNR
jgi:tetratricopeptide (TPR) repeat protein